MLTSLLRIIIWLALTLVGGTTLSLAGMYLYLSPALPSVESLREVKLQTPLRVYSADNKLIGEFGEQRRTPIRYQDIPERYIDALLAAEDEEFYSHNGVSIKGLMRAVSHLLITGEKKSGGSTITMQVTRHFFLNKKKHFKRKFNEILLALRIEEELDKTEILELYVNVMFMGNRAYGIQAAAETYYGKDISDLSTAQLATLAGLYKAPSIWNPLSNPERAKERRDWILHRMADIGKIDENTLNKALSEPVTAQYHQHQLDFNAPYVAEVARQQALNLLGPKAYTDGYSVYTSINSELQASAQKTLRHGLEAYDSRHGYRGPERRQEGGTLKQQLQALEQRPQVYDLIPALISEVNDESIEIYLSSNETTTLSWATLSKKLRLYQSENITKPAPDTPHNLFKSGDIIRLKETIEGWKLTQIPEAQSSLVSINAFSGEVVALVGGYHFGLSSFNRIIQAERQPGSNFKPFLYTAALENGFTPATLINDAPVVFDDNQQESTWRPENSSGKFYGPTRLRKALYLSRNLVSIRVLRSIGINTATDNIARFGVDADALPKDLSLALGSYAMTPFDIAAGYATFANGGFKITPFIVDSIQDDTGAQIFQSPRAHVCNTQPCMNNSPFTFDKDAFSLSNKTQKATQAIPELTEAPRVISEEVAYLMDSMLRDVVRRGTATKARTLNRSDLAGKTGTTNGPTDAWFSGYAGGLVTTTWVGFDDNSNLGVREFGGSAALPIWIDFMRDALENRPEFRLPQPAGIVSVRINPETGERARIDDPDAIFEVFRAENAPQAKQEGEQQSIPNDIIQYHEEVF
jgi:penicillin-binding protein 1A